ncbi:MAG: tyrosine--tRNA ligase [Flavobacteriales bacterium]|nr:tyrosine--tRNA ligase [Flavobacteriales bacterium]
MMNFVEEMKWRGMIHDIMPGTEEQLQKEVTSAYIGFDPTADSLHIGSLVQIMTLVHLQRAGHKPLALVGGATGMVGDPSGKSKERNLLSEEILAHNLSCVQKQLACFLDFECGENSAEIVNNYDWFKDFNFLDFIRDVGKHISINYMMAKDSVKSRLETGMSFTEFTYQLVQGYDFYHLYTEKNCKLQLGGSDQWGNIVTGTELIRRKARGEAYAITTPLIKKADGTKFGKTEGGNVWLDAERTSPYKFYQYWLNASDEDAKTYIKIFTLMSKEAIDTLIAKHEEVPHQRALQKALGKDVTERVHGTEAYQRAIEASEILFGKNTAEQLKSIQERDLLDIFEGVPQFEVSKAAIEEGVEVIDLLAQKSQVFSSNGDARRMLKSNAVSINKVKVTAEKIINSEALLNDKYILVQKGKKNYFLLKAI